VVGLYAVASRRSEAVSLRVVSLITISMGTILMDVSVPQGPFDSSGSIFDLPASLSVIIG